MNLSTTQPVTVSIWTRQQWALEQAERTYAKALRLECEAWEMFDTAVDEGQPADVRNDIAEAAEAAETYLRMAWHEMDAAKIAVLAACN